VAGEDRSYIAWIRSLNCCAPRSPTCLMAPSEAHHSTHHSGMGQRSHDHEAIPLCRNCHRAFHDARGPFRGWDKAKRLQWQDEQVRLLHEIYDKV
jgi:hypothetical protein